MENITLAEGISQELLAEGQIILFKVDNVHQETIDVWSEHVEKLLQAWSFNKPYLAVYDLTHPNVTLTPYLRKRASDMTDLRREVRGRIALVLSPTPFAHSFKLLMKALRYKSRQTAIFFDREAAIKWVSLELTK